MADARCIRKEIEEQLHWFKDFSVMSDEVNDDAMEYMNLLQKDIFEAMCMS